MVIIASWNVNSIRVRFNHVKNFLNKVDPDILLLQEIKCLNDEFPNFFGCFFSSTSTPSFPETAIVSSFIFTSNLSKINFNNVLILHYA